MKSLVLLWSTLYGELAAECQVTVTNHDAQRLRDRVKHEGLSFLTITLAQFGKDFERSLDRGYVSDDVFAGFRRHAGLPLFLGGFLRCVFNSNGIMRDDTLMNESAYLSMVCAIRAIKQLTQLFAKIGVECNANRTSQAIRKYVECEEEMTTLSISESDLSDFTRVATVIFGNVLAAVDSDVYHGRIVPKHGPGATADRATSNQKYTRKVWTDRLEQTFPAIENAVPSYSLFDYVNDEFVFHSREQEWPVRVITVPKTLKTPRIIAIEPTHMQFMQQGVLESIVRAIESDQLVNELIGFRDQTPNQRLALKGSLDGSVATLDLSEASDRVHVSHVQALLAHVPHFSEAAFACRSERADVPGHGVISLSKFASMGSALCFPMEAMVFCTIIFLAIERKLRETSPEFRMTRRFAEETLRSDAPVRVYGDDLIVPAEMAFSVADLLHAFGFVVNQDKSFWTGRFRESCGREYWNGEDVSPIKIRSMFPTRLTDASEVISTMATRNQLYKAGYWQTVGVLDGKLSKLLKYYPKVHETSVAIAPHTYLPFVEEKYDETKHRPLVKAYVVSSVPPSDQLDGYGALLKFHLKRTNYPYDVDHLMRSGRPRALRLKHGWVTPY